MRAYCTYFDRNYLAQGVALIRSIVAHDRDAAIWVLALDEHAASVLEALKFPGVGIVPLTELLEADPGIKEVRQTRPRREFIFTLTAAWLRFVLKRQPEIATLAYVDADMLFFADPALAWDALRDGSILIVPHRFPAWHDDSAYYGRYNVGWLVFRRDAAAMACLDWWRSQCIASCALKLDGTQYGDQKYLDAWPGKFPGAVRECTHPGVNLAPWNWSRHKIETTSTQVRVDGENLILFHFAQWRKIRGNWWSSGQLEYGVMPPRLRRAIYAPYVRALREAQALVSQVAPDFVMPEDGWRDALGPWHLALLRLFWGQFWRESPAWLAVGMGMGRWSGHVMGAYRRKRRARL